MVTTTRKLIAILTRKERWQLVGLLSAMLVMGLLQVAGVGSVVPLVGLMANPDLVEQNPVLGWAYGTLGFSSQQGFLMFIGIFALTVVILSNAFIAFTIWLLTLFVWGVQARLSVALLDRYLSRPYATILDRNSADTGKNVLYEVQQLTSGVLMPLLRVIAFGMTALFIAGFLIWFNPLLALLALTVLGGSYVLLFFSTRHALHRLGRARSQANTLKFKAVGEAFGGIKETKVLGREYAFVERLTGPARQFARSVALQEVLGQIPRYAIDGLAFASVLGAMLYLVGTGAELGKVVTVVGVYAFAGFRLLPPVQYIYQGWSLARFSQAAVDTVYGDLHETQEAPRSGYRLQASRQGALRRLPFERALRLEGVTFTYPNARFPVLQDVSLVIPRGSSVALVGETGAGKTTLADVILGLLPPQRGLFWVDDVAVHEDGALRAWQNNLGYVPQEIYLTDDTVTANIAFGVPADEVDHAAVERAAHVASIHDFIEKLPSGYNTVFGERGVRLSGGQRQRIGIARALYHEPEVLVLDEATSDLDGATEAAVHMAITQAAATKTVIFIAHRLSTTRSCDALYLLDHGRVVAQGTYAELEATNERFQRLARAGLGAGGGSGITSEN